jgi:small subunit ribosomal protein S15
MPLTKEKKKTLLSEFGSGANDTGSSAIQIALLTERIQMLTEHLKTAKKDFASRQGLFKMVGKRRQLLDYLKWTDFDRYQSVIQKLDLRK